MVKPGASVPFRATNPRLFGKAFLDVEWRVLTRLLLIPPSIPKSSTYESQGNHFGGRPGNAALSADRGNVEAIAANLRQAANLLFTDHADAGRHPRNFNYHDA